MVAKSIEMNLNYNWNEKSKPITVTLSLTNMAKNNTVPRSEGKQGQNPFSDRALQFTSLDGNQFQLKIGKIKWVAAVIQVKTQRNIETH